MIKKFIDKLFGKSASSDSAASGPKKVKKSPFGTRHDIGVKDHGINPKLVDERAWDVVHTLKEAGFEAYIVGGAVRDLLVGLRPKDFDVATDATPEQVKQLFRRAFIIGRRFRPVAGARGRTRRRAAALPMRRRRAQRPPKRVPRSRARPQPELLQPRHHAPRGPALRRHHLERRRRPGGPNRAVPEQSAQGE